jgi:hypothetical protein
MSNKENTVLSAATLLSLCSCLELSLPPGCLIMPSPWCHLLRRAEILRRMSLCVSSAGLIKSLFQHRQGGRECTKEIVIKSCNLLLPTCPKCKNCHQKTRGPPAGILCR